MKKNFELIGDIAHIFIGFTLVYLVLNLTDIQTIKNGGWLLGLVGGGLIGVFAGAAWELIEGKVFKIKENFKDIIRTTIGAAIGGVLASSIKDVTFITTYCKIVSIVFALIYIYILIKNKNK
jgi:uncharacterized MAPEG superfamily protein